MTVRPPRRLSGSVQSENVQSALDYEIAQEKAATLGRLGRRLEDALGRLRDFDAAAADGADQTPEHAETRRTLIQDAGTALWHLVVQREILGLRDNARLLADYQVPEEVRNRSGVVTAAPPIRRWRRR